jgi:hypothetical protein
VRTQSINSTLQPADRVRTQSINSTLQPADRVRTQSISSTLQPADRVRTQSINSTLQPADRLCTPCVATYMTRLCLAIQLPSLNSSIHRLLTLDTSYTLHCYTATRVHWSMLCSTMFYYVLLYIVMLRTSRSNATRPPSHHNLHPPFSLAFSPPLHSHAITQLSQLPQVKR